MTSALAYLEKIIENWETSVLNYAPKLFLAVLLIVIFFVLAKIVKKTVFNIYKKTGRTHSDIVSIVSSIAYFFLLLSGIFLALQVLGLEKVLANLLTGAGIVGIIAGFAFKDIASNIFAGLLLKIQSPFHKNDWVQIDNSYGEIIQVGWITTVIKTVPGQEVFVPNQLIYSNTFTNYSTFKKRRIILESGVSYGDDLEHVKEIALDEVKKTSGLLKDEKIDFYFTAIGNSTYNFNLRFWIAFESNDDYCCALSDIIIRVKKRFEQEDISIAYPVTTLDFGVKGGVNLFDYPIKAQIQEAS